MTTKDGRLEAAYVAGNNLRYVHLLTLLLEAAYVAGNIWTGWYFSLKKLEAACILEAAYRRAGTQTRFLLPGAHY